MKQLGLLLLLLVAVSSTTPKVSNDIREYIEIVKCFLNQENLVNDVVSLVDIIKSGEYDKLLSLAFKLYTDGSAAVKECITKDETNLRVNTAFPSKTQSVPQLITKEICENICKHKYDNYQLDICLHICSKFKY